jgi:hypothetical protein
MLVLFAFSGTPKKILHDLTVNHRDTRSKFSSNAYAGVQQSIYSCHIEDLVVESPFMEGASMPALYVPVVYTGGLAEMTARLYAFFPVLYSLRGPPARA